MRIILVSFKKLFWYSLGIFIIGLYYGSLIIDINDIHNEIWIYISIMLIGLSMVLCSYFIKPRHGIMIKDNVKNK